MVPKICLVPECNNPGRRTRGMCRPHYDHAIRTGKLAPLPKPDPKDRFWSKVTKTETCWVWNQAAGKSEYGRFTIGYKQFLAHRLSYEWAYGQIGQGIEIDHTCHNRACVNPAHLRPATHKQNLENRAGAQINSKSGIRGVSWKDSAKKWVAQVKHNGTQHYLGSFDSMAEAEAVVIAKRKQLHTHNYLDRI